MARALGFAVMAAAAIVPGAALLSLPRRSTSAATSLASTATEADRKSAEAAFREEVERRKLKASRGPEGSAAYLATLGNRMSGYDPNLEYRTYLDDLDNRVSWRFAKELARRKAALEAEREADGYTLTPTDASAAGFRRDAADAAESESLLAWQGAMLFVTIAWATNFAVTAYACDGIAQRTGLDASTAAAAFVVGRFGVAALSTAPLLASASSSRAVAAGLRIGLLYAAGYAAQAAALAHGFPAANCAFVCSLQCVAVALLAPGKTPLRSWVGVALAVGGVACLELLGASEAAPMDGVGLALALGQPLAFGASYVDLERAMEDFPDDSAAMSALQCLVIFASAAGALVLASGGAEPALAAATAVVQHADAPLLASLGWTGLVSTSFTIWLCAQAFKRLPAVDASLILTSEPLWAAAVAAVLLGDRFGASDVAGGALILLACAVNDEILPVPFLQEEKEAAAI